MQDFLFIHLKRKFIRIDFKDIRYVLSVGHHVKISTDHGNFLPHLNLKEIEAVLPSSSFCRVNRGTIVAINRILTFDRESVVLKETSFSFSDKYRKEMEAKVIILLHQESTPTRQLQINGEGLMENDQE